jgi:TonB-linked SusC/RagA family outer membrane protein
MKFTTILTILTTLQISASVYSQNAKININVKNTSILGIFNEIERQSEFRIFYKTDQLDLSKRYDLEASNTSISEVLSTVLGQSNASYKLVDKIIVITPGVNTQQLKISGIVTDGVTGEPLPGVNVVVEGSTIGTVTDGSGRYSLDVSSPNAVLIFSSIGYNSEKAEVNGKNVINVRLLPDIKQLEEVVVVGYGTQRKVDLTGSVTSVSGRDLTKSSTTDPLIALQGKAPGVDIVPVSGQPGSGIKINIRGVQSINASSNPIYVIDGIITESVGNINTNDIETISILKDASSTAIYGSRAANGVVLITTKRGTKSAPVITFNTYQSVRTKSNLMPKMLNSDQFLGLLEESYRNSNQKVPNTDSIANIYYRDANGKLTNTDWMDVIMQPGSLQYYDLSVSGGSEKSTYFTSVNYLKEKGVILGQGQSKLNFRFNSNHKVNTFMEFGNTLNLYSNENFGFPSLDYTNYANNPNPYMLAMRKVPLTKPYEEDGGYGFPRYQGLEYRYIPPHLIANEYKRSSEDRGILGNIFLNFNIVKGLTFKPSVSIEYNNNFGSTFLPTVNLPNTESRNVNSIAKASSRYLHWQTDYMLNYDRTFNDKHHIALLAGYSQEEAQYEYLNGSRDGSPIDEVQYLNAGNPATSANTNGYSDWSFVSYLGRINYEFQSKYLFQATIRRDGTSRFVKKNLWGIFPSYSVGWVLSKEKFFEGLTGTVNLLKLRASFGTLGNALVAGSYPTYSSLNSTTYILNETVVPGYTFRNAINEDLKWETTHKKDIGLDMDMFDSRVSLSASYFISNTVDLLYNKPLPPSSGKGGSITVNGGEVQNKGIEIILGLKNNYSDFSYDVSFNFAAQKNEVIDLAGQELTSAGLKVGYPVHSYYGFRTNGIIKNQNDLENAPFRNGRSLGDVWIVDVAGKKDTIDNADKVIIGKRFPDFTYGMVSNFNYKRFSLSIQVQGVQGIDLPYSTGNYFQGNPENNRDIIMGRWDAINNPDGNMPKVLTSDPAGNLNFSEFWLTDASYLRINNVNLSYNIPENVCQKVLMKNASIYFSVQNLYTFTRSDFKGVETDIYQNDPSSTGSVSYYGDASQKMPIPRTWTMGVKVSF